MPAHLLSYTALAPTRLAKFFTSVHKCEVVAHTGTVPPKAGTAEVAQVVDGGNNKPNKTLPFHLWQQSNLTELNRRYRARVP